jgi:tetratricopeptide (TPR) repeat protein
MPGGWGEMRALGSCLVMMSLLPCASIARADNVEVARQRYEQGSKDFDLGRYDDAVKEYAAAYDAKPDPALLYNIAQAHKLAGHAAEALRFYRVFLVRLPKAPNADEVRIKIAELQRVIDQQQKAQTMPPDQSSRSIRRLRPRRRRVPRRRSPRRPRRIRPRRCRHRPRTPTRAEGEPPPSAAQPPWAPSVSSR